MTQATIRASKIFTVGREFDASVSAAARNTLARKRSRNSPVANILYDAANRNPETRKSIARTLLPLAEAANDGLDDVFGFMEKTLTDSTLLPSVRRAGGKRFSMTVLGQKISYTTDRWPMLSDSYTKRLKAMSDAGKRVSKFSDKRFWYERPEWTDESAYLQSLSAMMEAEFDSGLITEEADLFKAGAHPYGVSFGSELKKVSKVPAHIRHTKQHGAIAVGLAKGDMYMPTKSPAYGTASQVFTDYVYTSFAEDRSGRQLLTGSRNLGLSGRPNLVQLLLINEYRRPFFGRAFQKAAKTVIDKMRKLALTPN